MSGLKGSTPVFIDTSVNFKKEKQISNLADNNQGLNQMCKEQTSENHGIQHENNILRAELHRMKDVYDSQVKSMEQKILEERTLLDSERQTHQFNIGRSKHDFEILNKNMNRDHEEEISKLKIEVNGLHQANLRAESEIQSYRDKYSKNQLELEERLRSAQIRSQEQEFHKYQHSLKDLRTKQADSEMQVDSLRRTTIELQERQALKEKSSNDYQQHKEKDLESLKKEVWEIKEKESVGKNMNDKLRMDLNTYEQRIRATECENMAIKNQYSELELQKNGDIELQKTKYSIEIKEYHDRLTKAQQINIYLENRCKETEQHLGTLNIEYKSGYSTLRDELIEAISKVVEVKQSNIENLISRIKK